MTRRHKGRGQSLVEFAITLPIVLLMVLFGIDFGRVYLGWVTLNNAVREAANFAAYNPTGWSPRNNGVVTEYERLIATEAAAINCTLPAPIPDPSFPSGSSIGSPAVVAVTCQFSLITPLIGAILGQPLNVSASASFPIRSGAIQNIPVGTIAPTPSGSIPTVEPPPTAEPPPTVAPTPTPVPTCRVPNFRNDWTDDALVDWTGAGFNTNNMIFSPLVPPDYRIRTQTLTANQWVACDSTITVQP